VHKAESKISKDDKDVIVSYSTRTVQYRKKVSPNNNF
jgi:hypothetical protein